MPRRRKKDSGLTRTEADMYRDLARKQYRVDGIEIDYDAPISASDPIDYGVYVQAWVWVNAPDKDEDESWEERYDE